MGSISKACQLKEFFNGIDKNSSPLNLITNKNDFQLNDFTTIVSKQLSKSIELNSPHNHNVEETKKFNIEIKDAIYGTVCIDSPCAIEIIDLKDFKRLKNVLQHGITALIGCLPTPSISRFDHSLGAMILVKSAGGTEEAQLAALLHDVAHTAFSHVVDYVFDYVVHEVEKFQYLETTKIPQILRKYGFNPERILNEELFPLLELPSPEICADRLDYGLRDSVSFGFLSLKESQEIFESILSIDGQLVLSSMRAASILANAYLDSDQNVWADPCQTYLYRLTAKVIKAALLEGTIDRSFLWKTGDQELWELLNQKCSRSTKKLIAQINGHCKVTEIDPSQMIDPEEKIFEIDSSDFLDGDGDQKLIRMKLKLRAIDPLVRTSESEEVRLKRLSEINPDFSRRLKDYVRSREKARIYRVENTSKQID
ncbi:hypothetical protein BY996DRAFT_4578999 [Phakopsora pachyrhizi]|uniref:HD/PDEase domain-containing protein n=1 Tax=Phakopsora pachyrhizi TaxID=170000 RepID=A0AAV0BV61_PHAPC|nr:hypothetical protein BY996DRAFT_4578999 [Phakopsora pachyrhizi]CAH7690663.1 hypothetical protein PPACK8108_LOCUS26084 [Phakopsora pachyrhizi]